MANQYWYLALSVEGHIIAIGPDGTVHQLKRHPDGRVRLGGNDSQIKHALRLN